MGLVLLLTGTPCLPLVEDNEDLLVQTRWETIGQAITASPVLTLLKDPERQNNKQQNASTVQRLGKDEHPKGALPSGWEPGS